MVAVLDDGGGVNKRDGEAVTASEEAAGQQKTVLGPAPASSKLAVAEGEASNALVCRKGGQALQPGEVDAGARGSNPSVAGILQQGEPGSMMCAIAIHELNEEAIELIFTFLPPQDRRSAAAVCRLWRRVHNSSTKLWGTVLLSGERIMQAAASSSAGAIVSWVSARLEAMRSVWLWSPSLPLEGFASGLAQLLSRENRLQAFSYVASDASVSRLLGELQGLTSLQLLDILAPAIAPGQGLVVRARELAKLKPLSNLLSLQLHAREIRGALPPALFRCLHRLKHLTISAKCRLPAAVVHQLTGLQSLELHGASMDAAAAEAAAGLQQLTRLAITVHSMHATQQEGDGVQSDGGRRRGSGSAGSKSGGGDEVSRWQDHAIWGQLPRLARLQLLSVGADLPSGGEGMEGPEGASILPYDLLESTVPDGIMDCSALTHLALPVALTCLPDLVPGQLRHLAALDLTHSIVEALPPSWCCHLQTLSRLVLNGAPLAGGHLPSELAALQSLRHLELRACHLSALPRCVAALSALTHLDLGINRLAGLPDGPYLGQLRQLVLRSNELEGLPPALATAQHLQVLDLGENKGLALQPRDIDEVLAGMRALRVLVLSREHDAYGFGPYMSASSGAAWDVQSVGVLMQLARAMPNLAVQLERTELPVLPPQAQQTFLPNRQPC